MRAPSKKPMADLVHGCSLGIGTKGKFIVAKFDLGDQKKTMLLPASTVIYILVNAPVTNQDTPDYTFPAFEPADWDEAQTPTVTSLKIIEADNAMALLPILSTGKTDGLLFRYDTWSTFIKNLWQCKPELNRDAPA